MIYSVYGFIYLFDEVCNTVESSLTTAAYKQGELLKSCYSRDAHINDEMARCLHKDQFLED